MAYSSDLRKCVLAFIKAGGKKTEACSLFSIARATLYTWLSAEDPLAREKPGPRGPRTLDLQVLEKHGVIHGNPRFPYQSRLRG